MPWIVVICANLPGALISTANIKLLTLLGHYAYRRYYRTCLQPAVFEPSFLRVTLPILIFYE